jgi:hypothetical protein
MRDVRNWVFFDPLLQLITVRTCGINCSSSHFFNLSEVADSDLSAIE